MKRVRSSKTVVVIFLAVVPLLANSVLAQTLSWEVFWSSSGFEVASDIVSDTLVVSPDASGNVYIAGAKQPGPSGGYDAFVASFDRFGVLRWETFWGAKMAYDTATTLAIDVCGNIYIAGVTSPGPFGLFDVFVASFNSSGGLRWEAFWGTSEYEWARAVAVDTSGNIYVAGHTSHVYFPGPWDAFLVSFNSSGGFRWEAFWGTPNGYDRADAVAVDSLGNVYIGGRTGEGEVFGQPFEAFLLSYDSSGNLRWETLWGKVACDFVYRIAFDLLGNIYITGVTFVFGPFGGDDAFLVSFNSSGGFRWEAFWGTPNREVAYGVALDPSGNAYISGYASPGPLGGEDAFVASFDRFGVLRWETYWGGEGNERASGISLGFGNVYIAGHTNPGPLGGYDAFIAAFALPPINATVDINPNTLNLASNGKWITCYIEPPEDYDINDIDVKTIRLNHNIPVDLSAPSEIGDHDKDGIPDLMVKFDRSLILTQQKTADVTIDTGKSYEDTIKVWGIIKGMPFEGFDTVRILSKG